MSNDEKNINCPTCGAKKTWRSENAARPFCSPRCKLIDLGAWADEQHRIPAEAIPQDSNEEVTYH